MTGTVITTVRRRRRPTPRNQSRSATTTTTMRTSKDHICFSYDPAWVPAGSPPMGYLKKDYSEHNGQFVDHCPTENVIATCDRRGVRPD